MPSYNNFASAKRQLDPKVLHDVLARTNQVTGEPGLVLFDLDSTLLDNRPRQARIVREYGQSASVPALLRCAPDFFEGWGLGPPMRRCGLTEAEILEHEGPARKFWKQKFFTSEYCEDDIAIGGAVDFVHKIRSHGQKIVYCTGRHLEMREGTLKSFAREGFPLPDEQGVFLLMKPVFEIHDDEWKRIVRDKVSAIGEVLAAFDNEPTHINTYRAHFPKALCVHLATDESARGIPVDPEIPSVADFVLP